MVCVYILEIEYSSHTDTVISMEMINSKVQLKEIDIRSKRLVDE